ncbi:MAG TPA: hypothetical protein VHW23_30785 [Kofleriaceae bacterium]|jgi:hypothetical protein|nr:hypothetical protein [Kofleriaceae bacterium]
MSARALPAAVAAFTLGAACALGLGACEKLDHENIDRWSHTSKGPAKLLQAVTSDSDDPDLAAHAAANLIKRDDDREVFAALEAMPAGRRAQVVAGLAPRMWDIARIENERELPGKPQVSAKDALVRIRAWAEAPIRQQIDGYLIDWYCVASYEDRARAGIHTGASVMRLIGPPAGRKLIGVVNRVIAAPGQDKVKNRVGDQLLLGLAATGNPDAVKYVLDLARMDRGDPTLASRALAALYKAYVEPDGFAPADRAALLPNLPALIGIVRDDRVASRAADDAVAVIRAVGPPSCLAPLVGMLGAPHANPRFKFVVAQSALRCGGPAAVIEVVRALPDGSYAQSDIDGAISGEIARMTPRDQAQAAARALLGEPSTLSRWVGIEALGAMKASDDAPRVAALASHREPLVGYWGQRGEGKPDPTLGQRAREISAQLGVK